MLKNDVSTFLLEDIALRRQVPFQVKASKDVSSANQTLSTELKCSYDNGTALAQATVSDKINLTVKHHRRGRHQARLPCAQSCHPQFTYGPR